MILASDGGWGGAKLGKEENQPLEPLFCFLIHAKYYLLKINLEHIVFRVANITTGSEAKAQ